MVDTTPNSTHNRPVEIGDEVIYYAGDLRGRVTKVYVDSGTPGKTVTSVSVAWDNGAPDLGPYVLDQPMSSVRRA